MASILHATAKDSQAKVMRAVAHRWHRLAVTNGAARWRRRHAGVIVPRKTVGELRKLLDDADGAIDVSLSDTKIQFGFNGVERPPS